MAKYNVAHKTLFGLLCLLLAACEMVQEVELPKHSPKLTLRSTLNDSGQEAPNDYYYQGDVFVGRSQGVLDNAELEGVDNATVRLFDAKGQQVEVYAHIGVDQGEYRQSWGVYRATQNFLPISGEAYTMRVEAPGFKGIEATSTMPAAVSVTDVTLTRKPGETNETYHNYVDAKLQLAIQDNPAVENFYQVEVYALDSAYNSIGYKAYSVKDGDDIGIGESQQKELNRIFSDELYPSGSISFSTNLILPAFWYSQDGELYPVKYAKVQVHHLNKDEYLFSKTLEAQLRTSGNPFAEYSNVYSNVKYGYGVLGGMAVTSFILEL